LLREVGDPNTILLWTGGFRADGKRFLSLDGKGKASWWDTLTWQVIRAFRVETKSASSAALSPDGCLLGIGTQTGAVHWLNAETGELLAATSAAHRRHLVGKITFSADGTRAASVAEDGTVALWDPSSLQLIVSFKGHMQGAHGVAFSPEGRRLATGGGGREAVKLWDMATYRDLITAHPVFAYFWVERPQRPGTCPRTPGILRFSPAAWLQSTCSGYPQRETTRASLMLLAQGDKCRGLGGREAVKKSIWASQKPRFRHCQRGCFALFGHFFTASEPPRGMQADWYIPQNQA